MTLWVMLFTGGALGATTRFLVSGWIYARYGTAFPWGTLTVNALGSFLLGFAVASKDPSFTGPGVFIGAGFIAAFTTFSTFSLEAVLLLEQEKPLRALVYVVASILVGLAAVVGGLLTGS